MGIGASLAIGGITVFCFYQLINTAREIDHGYQVIIKSKRVLGLLVDVSSGQRGYQLTKDREFLETYQTTRPLIPLELKELVRISSENPFQTEKLSRLTLLVDQRLAKVDSVITKPLSTTEQSSYLTENKQNLDQIRLVLDEIVNEEYSLLTNRKDRLGILLLVSGTSIFALLLYEISILLFFQYVANQEIKTKEELEIKLTESYQLLDVTSDTVYNRFEKYLSKNGDDEYINSKLKEKLKVSTDN